MKGKIVYGKPVRYFCDGNEVTKAEFDTAFPAKPMTIPNTLMTTSKAWPRKSTAMGVAVHQKAAAEEQSRRLGCPTEYVVVPKRGAFPLLRDSAHQRDLQKALGHTNWDTMYNQVAG